MSSDKHVKKEKKLAQILKNRHLRHVQVADEALARSRDLEKEREEELRETALASSRSAAMKKKGEPEPAWSAKMQQIRDRNTGRMRQSTERWNRFAGTEGGGGRGL